jgi:hypothetical protein
MAASNVTQFLESASAELAEPQAILSAVVKLLARPEDVVQNADLALSLVEIANLMIGKTAVEMDDFEPSVA